MDLQAAVNDFLLAGQADGLSPATIQWRKSQLGKLTKRFVGVELESIETRRMREYIVELRNQTKRWVDAPQRPAADGGLSPESVSTHIRCLHTFFRWCASEYGIDNPMTNVKYPQPQTGRPKAANPRDFIALLEATGEGQAGARDKAILTFLADTGCRLGGLLSLTIQDLDLSRRRAIIQEKGNTTRIVFFTSYTRLLLDPYAV